MDLYREAEARVAEQELVVYTSPSASAPERGRIGPGSAFWALGPADGPGCDEGWARLQADGYACLDGTSPTEERPAAQPALLSFDLPRPEEYESYLQTGSYDASEPELLLPALWGRRSGRFRGALYESPEAGEAGEAPVGRLSRRPARLVRVVDERWLVLEDGRAVRGDEVYLSPASRLSGRALREDPAPEGTWPALVVDYDGVAVRSEPDEGAPVVGFWPYHTWLYVEKQPQEGWWQVPERGFVPEAAVLHAWTPGQPPGPGLWVEISVSQQALSVYEGQELVYFTAVSTSRALRELQGSEQRILEKRASADLRSRPGEAGTSIEDVPWTMFLQRTCAIHGAWWHWGLGHPAREGCVHLAPRDAAWLFGALSPALPDGWSSIVARPGEGTPVRIRE